MGLYASYKEVTDSGIDIHRPRVLKVVLGGADNQIIALLKFAFIEVSTSTKERVARGYHISDPRSLVHLSQRASHQGQ